MSDTNSKTTDMAGMHIDKKPFDGEVFDVMDGAARWEIKVHDHGLVSLVDVMPRLAPVGKTADYAIVQAARVSYGAERGVADRGMLSRSRAGLQSICPARKRLRPFPCGLLVLDSRSPRRCDPPPLRNLQSAVPPACPVSAEPRWGLAGRLASVFLRSRLTPVIVIAAILLGVVAVALTPREEEPQIVVPYDRDTTKGGMLYVFTVEGQ